MNLSKISPKINPAGVLSKFWSVVHLGNYGDRDESDDVAHIYYTVSNGRNRFLLHQAMSKYRDEISWKPIDSSTERRRKTKKQISILREEFGGEIKIHHTNNKKLKRIDIIAFAVGNKMAISLLRKHLEAKQEKRKRGLGLLIRRKYVKGRKRLLS